MEKTVEKTFQVEGIYTIRAIEFNPDLERDIELAIVANDRSAYMDLIKSATIRTKKIKNLITLPARAMIAGRIAGDNLIYTGVINYLALGTSTTAADEDDTELVAEVYRKRKNIYSSDNNVATLDWYFTKANVDGTFQEIGTFIDGEETADSGLLFSRIITGGWPKTSNEGMAVTVQYTIINS